MKPNPARCLALSSKWINFLTWINFRIVRFFLGRKLSGGARNYCEINTFSVRSGKIRVGMRNGFAKGTQVEVCGGELNIGDYNFFNSNTKIVCMKRIQIGSHCIFADSVHVYDHDHKFNRRDVPIREQGYDTAAITIGDNVWLGAKVTVLKGVTIGDGVVVAAGAVVTKDLPAYSVCGGVPARVLKYRREDE